MKEILVKDYVKSGVKDTMFKPTTGLYTYIQGILLCIKYMMMKKISFVPYLFI